FNVLTSPLTSVSILFFFTATAPSQIYTLSLHDALPISCDDGAAEVAAGGLRLHRARRTDVHGPGERVRDRERRRSELHRRREDSEGITSQALAILFTGATESSDSRTDCSSGASRR